MSSTKVRTRSGIALLVIAAAALAFTGAFVIVQSVLARSFPTTSPGSA